MGKRSLGIWLKNTTLLRGYFRLLSLRQSLVSYLTAKTLQTSSAAFIDTKTIESHQELHKIPCNLEKMTDTPLSLHSGLWLSFSEAVLAHSVGSKHGDSAVAA